MYNPPPVKQPYTPPPQLTRHATVVQWQMQADTYTVELVYHRNGMWSMILATAHGQKHDICTHTQGYHYIDYTVVTCY